MDPLVLFSRGLSEAALHAEIYRILHSFFRNQKGVSTLTETRVISSIDDPKSKNCRCDIWIKTSFSEFGIELKTECDTNCIQNFGIPQIIKYSASRNPREMILLNFVMKEEGSITFPIKIDPIELEKFPKTSFTILFVKIMGDIKNGLKFCYAKNGDTSWTDLKNI